MLCPRMERTHQFDLFNNQQSSGDINSCAPCPLALLALDQRSPSYSYQYTISHFAHSTPLHPIHSLNDDNPRIPSGAATVDDTPRSRISTRKSRRQQSCPCRHRRRCHSSLRRRSLALFRHTWLQYQTDKGVLVGMSPLSQ